MNRKSKSFIAAIVCVLVACCSFTIATAFATISAETLPTAEATTVDAVRAERIESEEDDGFEAEIEDSIIENEMEYTNTEELVEYEVGQSQQNLYDCEVEVIDYEPEPTAAVPYEESGSVQLDDRSDYVDANMDGNWYPGSTFMSSGRLYDSSGWSYIYYSENVLPGGGLSIPGRHVGDEGYVMDENGNLCIASDDLAYGTVVSVPFGSGTAVVYDCGSGYGNLDVYVSW